MDQVEEVKQKTDIVALVGGFVQLRNAGRNFKGLCPFHEEKTPSFMVNEELQIYKCFGCGKGGDAINFLMEVEGLEFREALEKLAERVGVKLTKYEAGEERSEKMKLYEAHTLACEYFHYILTKHGAGEEARKYLEGRGIGERTRETFRLGFALNEWDGLLTYLTKRKGIAKELLVRSGLVVDSSRGGYDRFRGRVMIPLIDGSDRVVGFAGRILPHLAEVSRGEEAKYINSPETEIYHKSRMLFGMQVARQEIRKKDRVVVVEGDFDMISSYTAGVTETVAIKGSALTVEMLTVLRKLTGNLVLALDADKAGEAAVIKSAAEAEKQGFVTRIVKIDGGKDPDEVARKSAALWKKQVDGAVEVYEFVMARAIERWGKRGPEAIRKVTEEVLPYFAKISNSVLAGYWVGKLSKILDVDEARMWEEMNKRAKREAIGVEKEKVILPKQTKLETLGVCLIGALYRSDGDVIAQVKKKLAGWILPDAWGKVMVLVLEEGPISDLEGFVKGVEGELREAAQMAYLSEEPDKKEGVLKMADDLLAELIRREQLRLAEEIKSLEREGKRSEVRRLSKVYAKLSSKRA